MRNDKEIMEILIELETVWKKHPDLRLGQLITAATNPTNPHPSTYYIEDDVLLKRLKDFDKPYPKNDSKTPLWKEFGFILRRSSQDLTAQNIQDLLQEIKKREIEIIISPTNLMRLLNAPVDDSRWMQDQQAILAKINQILAELASR